MNRDVLERHQVWFYLAGVVIGLAAGSLSPELGKAVESLVRPVIAVLLFATFTQIPLNALGDAVRDRRALAAMLIGNFLVMPAIVWALVQLVPDDPALRLGLLLVLLVPCTDWFITFTQLGGGDAARATAASPLLLVAQLLLLPIYLAIFTEQGASAVFAPAEVWPALLVIGAPLLLAVALARPLDRSKAGRAWRERMGLGPVPLLASVIALVAAAHVRAALDAAALLPIVAAVCVGYLIAAGAVAIVLGRMLSLADTQARTLVFSLATRNSFLVLPFALALPDEAGPVAIVIVMQSLIELFGMIFLVWFAPRYIHGGRTTSADNHVP